MEKINYLTVGYIANTRGLKGVVKVKSTSYFAQQRYKKGNTLYLHNLSTDERVKVIANSYTSDKNMDYVSFKDLEDINLVEKYIGWAIEVNKEEIPPLPKGTYYYSELEGLDCINKDSKEVFGKVVKVVDFTAQPSLKIQLKDSEKTIMVPYIDFFVKKIDLEANTITIKLIPGFID